MSKEIPYFRFTAAEWLNGDISLEDSVTKGIFIDICAYYWFNDCLLTKEKLLKKFDSSIAIIDKLIKNNIIKENKTKFIEISFLNDQFDKLSESRKKRQSAGRLGGKGKKRNFDMIKQSNSNAKAIVQQSSSYKDKDKDKENTSSEVEEKPFFAEEKLPKIKLITKDQFEIFWEIYSRKDGKGKALTNWNNLCNKKDRPEWKIVRTAIYEQIKTERWKNPKFIPLPATWINQKRWIDDPKAMTSFQDDTDVPFPLPRGWPSYKLQDGIKYSWDCQLDGYRHKNGNLMIE